jgi:oligopeptide transport system substrate-binding protein
MRKLAALSVLILFLFAAGTYWTWKQLPFAPVGVSVLRLSLDNVVESLDPAKAYSDDSLMLTSQVMEPLFQYHYLKRPYEIQPLLAEAPPQVLEKGKIIKIKIKKNIRYHDHPSFMQQKRTVKAEDFVNQIKRLALKSLKSPGRSIFAGLIEGFEGFDLLIGEDWEKISSTKLLGVEAIDEHTLLLRLTRPEPNIIYYLALNFVVPIPWEVLSYEKNDLSKIIVGTGPYQYRGFNGSYFRLERFRDYREDYYPSSGDRYANVQKLLDSSKERIPFIDEVKFFVTTDEEQRWQKFMNGELDLLNVPKTFLPKLYDEKGELTPDLRSRGVELKHFPILANRWLGFNMRDPLIGKNDYLRLAIAYAIDYERYLQVISQNTNLRANSILVPGISGYMPAKDFRFKYDPALAREYLKLSGLKVAPTITYSTRGNQEIHLVEANLIKEMLGVIGVKVDIEVLTFSEFLTKGRAGELMFFTDNWFFDYPDGENILQLLVSTNFPGINKSAYSNPRIDELYRDLKTTTNFDLRDKIIHQMEQIVFDDLPWIPLMYESSFVLQNPEIKNYRKSSIIRNYVKYLKITR